MFSIVKTGQGESVKILLVCLAILVFGILNVIFPPVNLLRDLLYGTGIFTHPNSACITLNVFGIPCAFCGMSRSLAELIRLNIADSFYYNPSAIFVYLISGFAFTGIVVLALKGYKVRINNTKNFWIIVFGIFLVVWVLNILFGNQ